VSVRNGFEYRYWWPVVLKSRKRLKNLAVGLYGSHLSMRYRLRYRTQRPK
jgi:hypothetical protein